MDKVLIISPQGGLGNRMRAVCSAFLVAEICGRKPMLYWKAGKGNSPFPHVKEAQETSFDKFFCLGKACQFEGKEVDVCFTEWLPGDYWYTFQSFAQQNIRCLRKEKLYGSASPLLQREEATILLETSLALTISGVENWKDRLSQTYRKYFIPNKNYLNLAYQLPCLSVGISVRRGEFPLYFPEANQSLQDVEAWLRELNREMVIFSDDAEAREMLRSRLNCSKVDFNRQGLSKLEQGFVEFLVLALRCDKVYGTPSSSFAEEAAIFGSRPYDKILNSTNAKSS